MPFARSPREGKTECAQAINFVELAALRRKATGATVGLTTREPLTMNKYSPVPLKVE